MIFVLLLCVVVSMLIIVAAKSRWYRFSALLMLIVFYFALPFGGGSYDDSYPMASDIQLFTLHLEDALKTKRVEDVSKALKAFNEDFSSVALDTEKRHELIEKIIMKGSHSISEELLGRDE